MRKQTNECESLKGVEDFIDIEKFLDKDGYIAVLRLYQKKLKVSTCQNCEEVCILDCICCDSCQYWFHYKCQKVSDYMINKAKSWR